MSLSTVFADATIVSVNGDFRMVAPAEDGGFHFVSPDSIGLLDSTGRITKILHAHPALEPTAGKTWGPRLIRPVWNGEVEGSKSIIRVTRENGKDSDIAIVDWSTDSYVSVANITTGWSLSTVHEAVHLASADLIVLRLTGDGVLENRLVGLEASTGAMLWKLDLQYSRDGIGTDEPNHAIIRVDESRVAMIDGNVLKVVGREGQVQTARTLGPVIAATWVPSIERWFSIERTRTIVTSLDQFVLYDAEFRPVLVHQLDHYYPWVYSARSGTVAILRGLIGSVAFDVSTLPMQISAVNSTTLFEDAFRSEFQYDLPFVVSEDTGSVMFARVNARSIEVIQWNTLDGAEESLGVFPWFDSDKSQYQWSGARLDLVLRLDPKISSMSLVHNGTFSRATHLNGLTDAPWSSCSQLDFSSGRFENSGSWTGVERLPSVEKLAPFYPDKNFFEWQYPIRIDRADFVTGTNVVVDGIAPGETLRIWESIDANSIGFRSCKLPDAFPSAESPFPWWYALLPVVLGAKGRRRRSTI